jgi:hypothetical protein
MYYRDRFISMLCVDLNTYHLQFVQAEEKKEAAEEQVGPWLRTMER